MIPSTVSVHHMCVSVPGQDLYCQRHMSCFCVISEILKEVVVRFVDICEIDDLSPYRLFFS